MASDSCCSCLSNFYMRHQRPITILISFASFFWYFVDIATDLGLSVQYYREGDYVWFGLTLSFVIFASLVMNTILAIESFSNYEIWKKCLIFITQTGPAFIYIFPVLNEGGCAVYGTVSEPMQESKPEHLHSKAIVRLMEAFCEAAPQLLLQVYIGFRLFTIGHHGSGRASNAADVPVTIGEDETMQSTMMSIGTTSSFEDLGNSSTNFTLLPTEEAFQEFNVRAWLTSTEGLWWALSCCTSAITLAWGMSAYYRVLHQVDRFKTNVTIPGTVPIILWQFLTITSRIFAMALFATVTPMGFTVLIIAHFVAMITWVLCGDVWVSFLVKSKLLNALVVAPVCIFTLFFPYFQSVASSQNAMARSRGSYLVFYCLTYAEILVMALMWFFNTPWPCDLCKVGLLVYILTSYPLGVLCQGLYYGLCRRRTEQEREEDQPSCCRGLTFRFIHNGPTIYKGISVEPA